MASTPSNDVLAQAAANMIVRWKCTDQNPRSYSAGVIYDKISCPSTRASSELYFAKNDLKWALGTGWVRRAIKKSFLPGAEYNPSCKEEDTIGKVLNYSHQIKFSNYHGTYKYQMKGRTGDVVQEVLYVKTKLLEYAPEARVETEIEGEEQEEEVVAVDDEIDIHYLEKEQEDSGMNEDSPPTPAGGSEQSVSLKTYQNASYRWKVKEKQLIEKIATLEQEVKDQAEIINRMETSIEPLQCSQLTAEERSQLVGQTLVKLSTAAGVYKKPYEESNNQETLSLEAGVMVHDLTSTCLISDEKLPLVIAE
mmetsp:Transcript_25995/g.43304  ORF Transcript_25995/g.43304 Transcript_25995/m.43304 type:complete len:308 (+) Transcript_25995:150-1073(+)